MMDPMRFLLVGWLTLVGLQPAAQAQVTLRLGTNAPEGSPWAEGCQQMAHVVEKNTKGAVRVKIFPAGMLGDEIQILGSVANKALDGAAVSVAATFEQIPELSALELPFLFNDEAEADTIFVKLWPMIRKTVAERGYRAAVYTSIGFRHLGSRQPLGSLADLRAVRFRAQPSPLHDRMWKLLGARATPIGLPQVAHALERNEVDGFDSALVWMFGAGWHQHIKQLTLSRHIYQPGIVLFGPGALAKLPAALHDLAFENGDQVARDNVRAVREIERSLIEQLPGLGVEVKPIAPALRAELKAALGPMRDEWRKRATPAGRRFLDAIEAELRRQRLRN